MRTQLLLFEIVEECLPVDPEAHPLCARKAQQTLMPVLQTQVKVESFETIMRTITTIMLSGDGVNFFYHYSSLSVVYSVENSKS